MRRSGHTITRRRERNGLAELIGEGPYFTDGVRLFRLAGVVSGSSGPQFVQLEDCRTLALSDHTEEELEALGLAPVHPASAKDEGENGGQSDPRGTTSTGAGLERASADYTLPSSTRRTGP
jgi:hypothetical protein